MLSRVGIRAKLNFMEYGKYTATVIQAKYPIGEMGTSPILQVTPEDGHALANPTKYVGIANRSRVNFFLEDEPGLKDPEYARLYEEFMATTDEAKRAELARKMQIRQVEQAYRIVMPMAFDLGVFAPQVRYTGYRSNTQEMSPFLETAWLAR